MDHVWQVAPKLTQKERNAFPEIHPIVLQLLWNRGLRTQAAIDEFLNPDYSQDVHDPFLFRDMERAVVRIQKALSEKEKIVVHGDYDADGVCGTATLVSTLRLIAPESAIEVYLPHREIEGYGLNTATITDLAKKGTQLIITVDCGTTNTAEVALAKKKGMDVIITDHHLAHGELPPADCIINPSLTEETYPFAKLSGTGVAFKLSQALLRRANHPEAEEKWLLDLVALGTIADYVPLVGENRTLTKYGLIVLQKTRRVGLEALYQVMGLKPESIDARSVAFQIVPRLNAAGRVDHANAAYALLMTGLRDEAAEFAQNLHQLNQSRQRLTEQIAQQAEEQIGVVSPEQFLVMAQGNDWPAGLIGLVASRLCEKHHRPAIIIGRRQNLIIGSGRSIAEFHITDALKKIEHLLVHYGGHRQACGFTLKDDVSVADFTKALSQLAADSLRGLELRPQLTVDAEIQFSQIDWSLVEALEAFAPFGEGNPSPVFASTRLTVIDWERVGANRSHLRLVTRDEATVSRRFIGFGFGARGDELLVDAPVEIAYEVGVNQWNGTQELQLKIIDLHRTS